MKVRIAISYIDHHRPLSDRRDHLYDDYFFICSCSICQQQTVNNKIAIKNRAQYVTIQNDEGVEADTQIHGKSTSTSTVGLCRSEQFNEGLSVFEQFKNKIRDDEKTWKIFQGLALTYSIGNDNISCSMLITSK